MSIDLFKNKKYGKIILLCQKRGKTNYVSQKNKKKLNKTLRLRCPKTKCPFVVLGNRLATVKNASQYFNCHGGTVIQELG